MNKIIAPLVILVLLIAGVIFFTNFLTPQVQTGEQISPSQIDFKNNVEIEVTWENLQKYEGEWIFDLTFTTHSGDLTTLPIADLAEIQVEKQSFKGFSWEITVPDSHHMEGILKLSNPPKWNGNKDVILTFTGIGGSETHKFIWGPSTDAKKE